MLLPARGTGGDAGKWSEYAGTSESVRTIPSHRILALLRGEKEGFLSVKIGPDPGAGRSSASAQHMLPEKTRPQKCVAEASSDGYHRPTCPFT